MADSSNVLIVSVGSAIATAIAVIGLWLRMTDRSVKLSDRITVADKKADAALQEAAEAKNEIRGLHEANDEMTRDFHDQLERMRRESGENSAAIRQHVTELAFFVRDNFLQKDDFTAAMTKLDAIQLRMDTKLDGISQQIRDGN